MTLLRVRFGVAINAVRARRLTVVLVVFALVVAGGGYAAYRVLEHATASPPPPPGCQAGTGANAISLDPGQAGIAATIAAVAARHKLPRQAVTIALATAMQESDLENLAYGDRDSVGVFQQRPSQGWGTAADLQDPVYATTKFYAALTAIPHYKELPVDVAAQDVQRSADGTAYSQYDYVAGQLAGDLTGQPAHALTCWYTPAAKQRANAALTAQGLTQTFGEASKRGVAVKIRSNFLYRVAAGSGWTAATWLVTHAAQYGITQVRYAGYAWKAADGSMGWQRDPPTQGSIVAG
jgi:hypothetical protein